MDETQFVNDRPQFNQKESRQTGLRDGYMRYSDEQRLDEVEQRDD